MAIPGIPQGFNVQTGNGTNLISWSVSAGATSYVVQRSEDDVSFTTITTLSGTPLPLSYLDTSVTLGTKYWYKVAASSSDGTSPYTISKYVIPAPTGEMSLAQIRLSAQERADRVNSDFVSMPEWNTYINQAMFELYDLLVTTYEDYFIATPISFTLNGSSILYPLPNGSNTFTNAITGATFTPESLYKLVGVDIQANTVNNDYLTLRKFNFADRNKFTWQTTNAQIYGVTDIQYRVLGSNIEFIPTPATGQTIRLWYVPRLTQLLRDTDTTSTGISGWIEYVIVRAAKYALDKEESDTSKLDQQIVFLKQRIEESASNRDAGMPDTISDTRRMNGYGWSNGWGDPW